MFARPRRNPTLEAYLGKLRASTTFNYTRTRTFTQIYHIVLAFFLSKRLSECQVTIVADDVNPTHLARLPPKHSGKS
jgi:hypothetical protein